MQSNIDKKKWLAEYGCMTSAFITPDQKFSAGWHASSDAINAFEALTGKKLAIVMSFLAWGKPTVQNEFPVDWAEMISARGSRPHLTWEPWEGGDSNSKTYALKTIIDGKWDSYITAWAMTIKKWGGHLLLRWGHEMNGNWYPWDGWHNEHEPQQYIQAWRHIVDIFRSCGADKVSWIWSPDVAEEMQPHDWYKLYKAESYFPGEDYIDWVGLDGYNFGHCKTQTKLWRSFDWLYRRSYEICIKLAPNKPIMIAEFGCAEAPGDKADWIRETFCSIENSYPQIKAFTWFNLDKEADWRVDSSPASLKAYQTAMQKPFYLAKYS